MVLSALHFVLKLGAKLRLVRFHRTGVATGQLGRRAFFFTASRRAG